MIGAILSDLNTSDGFKLQSDGFNPIRVGGGLQQPKAREIGRHLKMGRGIELKFGEFLS